MLIICFHLYSSSVGVRDEDNIRDLLTFHISGMSGFFDCIPCIFRYGKTCLGNVSTPITFIFAYIKGIHIVNKRGRNGLIQ